VIALAIGALVGTLRTTPPEMGGANRQSLRRDLSQRAAHRADVLWFFVAPELLPKGLGDWIKQMPPPWARTSRRCCAWDLHLRARRRAGPRRINSLPRGQRMAGIAMGLTETQTYLTSPCRRPSASPRAPVSSSSPMRQPTDEFWTFMTIGALGYPARRTDAEGLRQGDGEVRSAFRSAPSRFRPCAGRAAVS